MFLSNNEILNVRRIEKHKDAGLFDQQERKEALPTMNELMELRKKDGLNEG